MIENGHFYDLNCNQKQSFEELKEKSKDAFAKFLKGYDEDKFKKAYPKTFEYLTDTTNFYEQHFDQLQSHIKREKRQLIFDNPNRVNVDIEISIEKAEELNSGPLYLFNIKDKLNWLMIYIDGKHVTVASRYLIQERLWEILSSELGVIMSKSEMKRQVLLNSLYEVSYGDPCFIMYEKPNKQGSDTSVVLSVKYYDSVHQDSAAKDGIPLNIQKVKYRFRGIVGHCSYWLYVKSPKDFSVNVATIEGSRFNELSSQDEEIKALYCKATKNRYDEELTLTVDVVPSLRKWFLSIYKFARVVCCVAIFILALRLLSLTCAWDIPYVNSDMLRSIPAILFAVVAGLITTRGWLMHEEHVLQPLGSAYIRLVITLISLAACMLVFSLPLPLHELVMWLWNWVIKLSEQIANK